MTSAFLPSSRPPLPHQRQTQFEETLWQLLQPNSTQTMLRMITLIDLLNDHGPKDVHLEGRMIVLTRVKDAPLSYRQGWAESSAALHITKAWLGAALSHAKFRSCLLAMLQFLESLPFTARMARDRDFVELLDQIQSLPLSEEESTIYNRLMSPSARHDTSPPQGPVHDSRERVYDVKSVALGNNSVSKDSTVQADEEMISSNESEITADDIFSQFRVDDIAIYLETTMRMLRAPQSGWSEADCAYMIHSIFQKALDTRESYQYMLSLTGNDAQLVLDALHFLLAYTPSLPPPDRRQILKALQRLSNRSQLYPACLALTNVEREPHPIASGHFGEVYKGYFEGKVVALKLIKMYERTKASVITKAVLHEVVIWCQLVHRNVLPFLGIHESEEGWISLVSPWMRHGSLPRYLSQKPNANRLLLISDVASGLAYLHEHGVVHGDLKGVNILVSPSGHACLADFGLAKIADNEIISWTSIRTSSTQGGGTIRWQAPELHDPNDDVTPKATPESDVYSFACVCYEVAMS
ncbi:TKL/TKL-ccin protein kinase [Coprinopsis cinerea AmutBmut pab1-1]|nr:TKL/TKL-ccin protein kinase [Coprinopsis cinerea AmutBmut pab1-1]